MPLEFYCDHNVDRAIVDGLRLRRVPLLAAFEDDAQKAAGDAVMIRATELNRTLITTDNDFHKITGRLQRSRTAFSGVLFFDQTGPSIGAVIDDVATIAFAGEAIEFADRLTWLPLVPRR